MPPERPTALLLYRDAEHRVRKLALTPAAAAMVGRMLLPGFTVQAAIVEGAADAGEAVDDALLAAVSVLLGDLAERGVLLGGAPGQASAQPPAAGGR
jgi:hypothetical protein